MELAYFWQAGRSYTIALYSFKSCRNCASVTFSKLILKARARHVGATGEHRLCLRLDAYDDTPPEVQCVLDTIDSICKHGADVRTEAEKSDRRRCMRLMTPMRLTVQTSPRLDIR